MIYQITKRYLRKAFPDLGLMPSFTNTHTSELYAMLFKEHDEHQIVMKRDRIRQAFSDYFENLGRVVVLFKGLERIQLQIIPYQNPKEHTKACETLSTYVQEHEDDIEIDPKRSDLLYFPEKITREILQLIDHEFPQVNEKELIKCVMRDALELEERDIVVTLKNRIVIRKYKEPRSLQKHISQESLVERRFNGLPKEELEELKEEFFSEFAIKEFFSKILDRLFEERLSFQEIGNDYFERYAISLIKQEVIYELEELSGEEPEVLEGLAGLIMRENFLLIFKIIATDLLTHVMNRDRNAERFLQYYHGDITVFNRTRYRCPEISDRHGNRWNSLTILSIATQRQRDSDLLKQRDNAIATIQKELPIIESEVDALMESHEEIVGELDELDSEIKEHNEELDSLRDKLLKLRQDKSTKDSPQVKALNEKIKDLKHEGMPLFDERSEIRNELAQTEKELNSYKQRFKLLKTKITEERTKREQIQKMQRDTLQKYDLMLEGLAKALVKRKQKVG